MSVCVLCLCQSCLTQLDEDVVFNPLSLSSNLYQQLKSRGLASQARYPYRSVCDVIVSALILILFVTDVN